MMRREVTDNMSEPCLMPNIYFRGMSLFLKLRERFGNPRDQLEKVGLEQGQVVLDFGCGIGSYALPAARIVGPEGMVYALDVHPLAIKTIERRARQEALANLKTIHSGQGTGLPDESVDVVLLYDVFHMIPDQGALLQELHRVLRPGGLLSVIPDHMGEDALLEVMGNGDLFAAQGRHKKALAFKKQANGWG